MELEKDAHYIMLNKKNSFEFPNWLPEAKKNSADKKTKKKTW